MTVAQFATARMRDERDEDEGFFILHPFEKLG